MKKCPKCNGNMYLEWDYRWQWHCLQCGCTIKSDNIKGSGKNTKYDATVPLIKAIGANSHSYKQDANRVAYSYMIQDYIDADKLEALEKE